MKLNLPILLLLLVIQVIPGMAICQDNTYILNGTATQDKCNCYTLTGESEKQKGSVWHRTKIDLNNSFDFEFNVYLGCRDHDGADGIVFMLQPLSTGIGTYGEGMGFEGISPSIGIPLDTYENPERKDPYYDNISIQKNGIVTHGSDLAGPVPASDTSDNIEDCKWHSFRIAWNASVHKIAAYFDNVLRVEADIDIVKSIFNDDPNVYWGFSAATGVAYNFQRFCTALNPAFKTEFKNGVTCLGDPAIFIDQSRSFAPIKNYYWDLGDGAVCTTADPAPHVYTQRGSYTAKLAITGFDGCNSDTVSRTIVISDIPTPLFHVYDTCARMTPRITDESTVKTGSIVKWQWMLDGTMVSASQIPRFRDLPAGEHQLQLSVESSMGCVSGGLSANFNLRPTPVIDILADDNCINTPVTLKGYQKDSLTVINSWSWQFPDGQTGNSPAITHSFSSPGPQPVQLTAVSRNGCISDPVIKEIQINQVTAFAGNDTVVLKDSYFQLKGTITQTGNKQVDIKWLPANGLYHSTTLSTQGRVEENQVYTLSVTTAEGCTAEDNIQVFVFKESAIYIPTAFTPNRDGKNEILRPYLVGIKEVYNFSVFNRWGQLIFSTSKTGEGWDGTLRGTPQPMDTYVWTLKAIDIVGNLYVKKGTATLIR